MKNFLKPKVALLVGAIAVLASFGLTFQGRGASAPPAASASWDGGVLNQGGGGVPPGVVAVERPPEISPGQ